ncbi:MAG: ParB/RepB/Spo0J family partition protein [Clostridia bacterium]|nr:ParB/RepB/Spo0J family partition protein [Clostridia bacterium]
MKRAGLGKGLGALITENTTYDEKNSVIEVDINKIEPGVGQPRKNFDREKIEALAESIKEHGIIQPLIVTKENDLYYIIAGERRWRAARVAGIKKVPVIEREASTKEVVELALIENIQREDLNPVEEAEAYNKLIKDYSMTQEQVATVVGKSRPAVANMLRLLNLSKEVRNMLISGEISVGQARPLLAIEKAKEQNEVAKYVVKAELNARQIEQYVKKYLNKKEKNVEKEKINVDAVNKQEIKYVQDKLRASLGTKVTLNDKNGKGKITIEYYSKEERERLIDFLSEK